MDVQQMRDLIKVKPVKTRGPLYDTVIAYGIPLLGAATIGVSGWSLYSVLRYVQAPVWLSWMAIILFDGVWAIAAAVYVKRFQECEPFKGRKARHVMQYAYAVSLLANFAHGPAWKGATIVGVLTGLGLAVVSVAFKTVFFLIFPDYIRAANRAGLQDVMRVAEQEQIMEYFTSLVVPNTPEQITNAFANTPEQLANTGEHMTNTQVSAPNKAERVRELFAAGLGREQILVAMEGEYPGASSEVLKAEIRRQGKKIDGPYL